MPIPFLRSSCCAMSKMLNNQKMTKFVNPFLRSAIAPFSKNQRFNKKVFSAMELPHSRGHLSKCKYQRIVSDSQVGLIT